MKIRPEFKRRDIRSFVIRGGRMTEAQQKAFDEYWPQYGLSLREGLLDPVAIFGNDHPLVLEIGYGMGDSLVTMAQQQPQKNFIGIEVHPPGVGRLINEAGKLQLNNIRTYCADAIDILDDCIATASLERLQLYFPDPWHKKKHHKRRIVQPDFVERVVSRLQPGGIFHLCTDWQNYAEHMMEIVSAHTQLDNQAGPGLFSPRPEFRPVTKFEQRGERLGHGVWDLLFVKIPTGDYSKV